MLLGWLIVAVLEWAAWRGEPHYGSGLPPRYYVPSVNLPPAQPLEQVRVGSRGPQRDEAPTWIASPALRAEVLGAEALHAELLGEWPHAVPPPAVRPGERPEELTELDVDPWTVVALPVAPLGELEPEPGPSVNLSPSRVSQSRRSARSAAAGARARTRLRAWHGALQPRSARRPTASAAVRPGRGEVVARDRGPGATGRDTGAARPVEPAGLACERARMRPHLAVREVALAGLALLAAAVALAVTAQTRGGDKTSPQPEGSFVALAGSSGPAAFGRNTACGGCSRRRHRGRRAPDASLRFPHLHQLPRHDGAHAGRRSRAVRGGAPVRPDRRARAPARPARRAADPLVLRPSRVIAATVCGECSTSFVEPRTCRTNTM